MSTLTVTLRNHDLRVGLKISRHYFQLWLSSIFLLKCLTGLSVSPLNISASKPGWKSLKKRFHRLNVAQLWCKSP